MITINVSDILWAAFPFDDGGEKHRPALVLDMDDCGRVLVAYATSQRTSSVLDHEFTVSEKTCGVEALAEMGLRKDTRFDLSKRRWLVIETSVKNRIGAVPRRLLHRFMKAAKAAGLV